ncbi:MAG: polysaccharide pyruvyl transferase family protein [Acidobacteria bacterium]|nr:polysaccharide pyruvyl transferase family protein [Acidobacteriota bacterium]
MRANIAVDEGGLHSWRGILTRGIRADSKTTKIRVGLLAPYLGKNYGDAAILEAAIHNIRERIPNCAIHGIWGELEDTRGLHRVPTHPFYATTVSLMRKRREDAGGEAEQDRRGGLAARLKACLRRMPLLLFAAQLFYRICRTFGSVPVELRHWVFAFRLVRRLDMLVVAGSGQLNDQWGGPWWLPYALFKWALAARLMHTPFVFLSVGASCRVTKLSTLFFLRTALALASYRSYRTEQSKQFVTAFRSTHQDKVVPDLAFSLPPPKQAAPFLPSPSQFGIVGVAPTAYQHPHYLSASDESVYNNYLHLLAQFVSSLVRTGYTVVLFYSARQDRKIVDGLYSLLGADLSPHLPQCLARPLLGSFQDLRAQIETFDYVVASRLHAILLSHLARKPVVAISPDPKVDAHMNDLGQRSYCLDIHDLELNALTHTFDSLQAHRRQIQDHLQGLLPRYRQALQLQYDHVFGGVSHVR